jgi:hypothetical protein
MMELKRAESNAEPDPQLQRLRAVLSTSRAQSAEGQRPRANLDSRRARPAYQQAKGQCIRGTFRGVRKTTRLLGCRATKGRARLRIDAAASVDRKSSGADAQLPEPRLHRSAGKIRVACAEPAASKPRLRAVLHQGRSQRDVMRVLRRQRCNRMLPRG